MRVGISVMARSVSLDGVFRIAANLSNSVALILSTCIIFHLPEPVSEVAAFCKTKDIPLLYDGAHVLGLIACGEFQSPLHEGATWMTGSTHKTFPGPQRGVILGNLDAEA